MPFQSAAAQPLSGLRRIGVVIRRGGRDDWHAGLIYRDGDLPNPRMIDLPVDQGLRSREFAPGTGRSYWWHECVIDEINARLIAGRCHAISLNLEEHNIPYGIRYDGGHKYWDAMGNFLAPRPEDGLTCATFVLSVFSSLGHRVIDETTWPRRDADDTWQTRIVTRMGIEWEVPRERVQAQMELIGRVARIRPCEAIAATAAFETGRMAMTFAEVEPLGRDLEHLVPDQA